MKKTLAIIMLLMLYSLSSAQWSYMYDSFSSFTFKAVKYVSPKVVFLIGDNNLILKSADGGKTWAKLFTGFLSDYGFNDISVIDENNITAIGNNGLIIRTTDGGVTWKKQLSGTKEELCEISYADKNNGMIVGVNSVILRTTDSGASWIKKSCGDNLELTSVVMMDHDNAVISGTHWSTEASYSSIYKTTDGGNTWTLQKSDNSWESFFHISSIDQNNKITVGANGSIYRSTDAGLTWNKQNSGTTCWLWDACFYDSLNGIVIGQYSSSGKLLKTTNGGETWEEPDPYVPSGGLFGVSFGDKLNGIAVGEFKSIILTTDGGTTWKRQESGIKSSFYSLHAFSPDTLIAVGAFGRIEDILIREGDLKTITTSSIGVNDLFDVSFADRNNGAIVGEHGTILYSSSGTYPWTPRESGVTEDLFGVSCPEENYVVAVGRNGTILRSADGGLNWTKQTSNTAASLFSVCFVDKNTGTAVGDNGTLLKTLDGGVNWSVQDIGTKVKLNRVVFANKSKGIIVGNSGIILITSDGGQKWTYANSKTQNDFYGACFTDESHIIAVGAEGVVQSTTDGGANWDLQANAAFGKLYGVSFGDVLNGFIVSEYGVYYRTRNGITSVEDNLKKIAPDSYMLSQNFPNPFNPAAAIKFSIKKAEHVSLKVFDMLGREVSTLVNEYKEAGSHVVYFDGSYLPSGIYIYTIQAGSFRDSRKMTLLK